MIMQWKYMSNAKSLLFVMLLFVGLGTANADNPVRYDRQCPEVEQHRGHFDPAKFKKDMEDFITKEAGLTPAEAQKFFPVFHQSKMELRQLSRKIMYASMRIKKEKMTEQECDKALVEIATYRKRCAEIQNEAAKEWRKILPASKVLKVYNAEHYFGKNTFRTMVTKK